MKVVFNLSLFRGRGVRVADFSKRRLMGLDRKRSEKALLWLLESMVNINRMEIKDSKLPPLYKAGVRYAREDRTEIWRDAVKIFKEGFGDCEDLACWRIAELRNNHKWAEPYIRFRVVNGTYIYHVLVMRKGGKLEDPSRILGMAGRD